MDTGTIKNELRKKILEQIDLSNDISDETVNEIIDSVLMGDKRLFVLSPDKKKKLKGELFDSLRRLDIIQEYLEDQEVTEIMVNGKDNIFIERKGKVIKIDSCFDSEEKLGDVIRQIVSGVNRNVNESSPIADARLKNGARVNVVMAPVALNGPILTIRRFPDKPITMEKLIKWGTITKEAADFVRLLVAAGYNICISGGTSSGKTTLLNAVSGFIPKDQRVITIEDSAELQLQGLSNLVRLETKNTGGEESTDITIRDLIRAALRMRPDRIIVGEVRGKEAMDMLQCMNTGHDGSMSTGHANSAADMLSRLESMVLMGVEIPLLAIRSQIGSGIDIIIHTARMRDRKRRILEITEVTGYGEEGYGLNTLFEFEEESTSTREQVVGSLVRKNELIDTRKLRSAGLQKYSC
ncbi:MAG: CpaF family protein [Lachnospiraceae bacterium]|nr:CpaF family protein [Lachnospiraceae bacterium]